MKNQPFFKRLSFAINGIKDCWQHEKSFRTQALFAIASLIVTLLINPSVYWWCFILLAITLVLTFELVNTALEHLIDHLHPETHPKIKFVKDFAAGAVLIMSIGAACIGVLMIADNLPL